MTHPAPGKAHREGLTLVQLFDLFPDEAAAMRWFEATVWPAGRCCGHCGATNTKPVSSGKPMPYWCPDCRSYFSVRTGTAIAHSKVPLRKWAIAIYLEQTSLESGLEYEAPSRYRCEPAYRVVHAPSDSRSLGCAG